jgi:stage II sporulation protein D
VETLRIAMADVDGSVEVSASALSFGRDDDEQSDFSRLSGRARVQWSAGGLQINGAPWPEDAVRFRSVSEESGGRLRAGRFAVRGDLVVRAHAKRLQLINVLPLEEYIVGVVSAEMPRGFPEDALRAQAVAARTYAVRKKLDALDSSTHLGSTVLSQVYRGLSSRDERAQRAVAQTEGEVLTFNLEPIEAYFHASCGGRTEAGQSALSRDLPYLQPVECPCAKHAGARWELSLSLAEVRRLLGVPDDGPLRIASRSPTGRVRTLSVGSHSIDAVEFRQKVGYDRVKSLWFEVERSGGDAISLVGKGHGHGAGMCQWGAKALAERGWSYRDILLHYYPGAEIQRLY